ncbi:MAG: alpha/beta hydrolase-fold protein [Acidobacteriota bacterium]|nr:alpha/beta hydrolase-fold protein [Acidobacteriota bacterium]
MIRRFAHAVLLAGATASCFAQTPTAPPLETHQVNPDSTITFRYANRAAKQVVVAIDAPQKRLPMTLGEDGIWTVTTPKLAPEYYGYAFLVDGVTTLDPGNPDTRRNFVFLANNVLLPGQPPMPWELTAISHGRVDRHVYTTHVAKNFPANQSAYVVYTPPGYDAKRAGGYPVLYLLHGWSDEETAWTEIGRANLILDNLIAAKKAVPMIVVMTLGYGNLEFVKHGLGVWNEPQRGAENVALYEQALLTEVMPAVEREYDTAKGRENRAIIGLSMGGIESLYVGLDRTDLFAYIGGMSAAVQYVHFDRTMRKLDAKKADLRLLWVACGTGDDLIAPNRDFVQWAKGKGLPVTAVETPGAHVWPVWRDDLLQFAPLLFRSK